MGRPPSAIAHFIPDGVLRELRLLARRLQRDEIVKIYILWRMWMVIPLTFVFIAVAGICVVGVAKFTDAVFPIPVPTWLVLSTGALLLVVFLGAVTTQFYVLLSWLERGATRKHLSVQGGTPDVDIQDRLNRTSRIRSSFLLVATFVATPLLMFIAAFPSVAGAVGGFGLVSILLLMIVTGDRTLLNRFAFSFPSFIDGTTAWLIASFFGSALISGITAVAITVHPYRMPAFLLLLPVARLILICLIATVVIWVVCFLLRKHLISSISVIALCSLLGATYALVLEQLFTALKDMEDAGVAEWMRWTYVIGFPTVAIATLAAVSRRGKRDALQRTQSVAISEGRQ